MNKSIKILSMLLCLLFILCACGTKNTDSTVSDISSEASNNSTSDDTSNNDNVKECFEKILNNEQSFYCTNRETDMLLSDYQNFSKDVSYAYVDMDNDNTDELAIWLYSGDTLILRKEDTSVIGYLFGIKGMSTIFTDGCYLWQQGAGETYGCSRLEFTGKTYKEIELWRVENANSTSIAYYIDGKSVTEEELTSFNDGKEHQHIAWDSWSTLQAGFDYSTKLH